MKNIYFPFIFLLMFALAGCLDEFKDGYQFGDITRFTARQITELSQARDDYCAVTSTSTIKKAALLVIRAQLPGYPVKGICTQLIPHVNEQAGDNVQGHINSRFNQYIRDGPPGPLPA